MLKSICFLLSTFLIIINACSNKPKSTGSITFSVEHPEYKNKEISLKFEILKGKKMPYYSWDQQIDMKRKKAYQLKVLSPDVYRVVFQTAKGYGKKYVCIENVYSKDYLTQKLDMRTNLHANANPIRFVKKIKFRLNKKTFNSRNINFMKISWTPIGKAKYYTVAINKRIYTKYGTSYSKTYVALYNYKKTHLVLSHIINLPLLDKKGFSGDFFLRAYKRMIKKRGPFLLVKNRLDAGEYWIRIVAQSEYSPDYHKKFCGISSINREVNFNISK